MARAGQLYGGARNRWPDASVWCSYPSRQRGPSPWDGSGSAYASFKDILYGRSTRRFGRLARAFEGVIDAFPTSEYRAIIVAWLFGNLITRKDFEINCPLVLET